MAEYQRKTKPQFISDFVSKSEIPPVRIRVVRVKFLSETVGDHFEAGAKCAFFKVNPVQADPLSIPLRSTQTSED
jgi:hypothetical protein